VQFLNNQIPAARISPIAKKLLGFLTPPNVAGAPLGTPNLVFNSVREKITHAFDAKVNYNITDKDVLSYRFSLSATQGLRSRDLWNLWRSVKWRVRGQRNAEHNQHGRQLHQDLHADSDT
jgi:hypothetical protein